MRSKVKSNFTGEKVESFAELILGMINIYPFLRNLFLRIWVKSAKISSANNFFP